MGATGDINDLYAYRWYGSDDSTAKAAENTAWGSVSDSYAILHTICCFDSTVCNKPTDSEAIKLQVDKDGGGYVDVAAGSGDVRVATSTNVSLSDGTTVTQKITTNVPTTCTSGYAADGLEVEGSDATSNAVAITDDSFAEWAWGLDLTNAAAGSTYSFRFYNVSTNSACTQTATPALTVASAPVTLVISDSGECYHVLDDNDGSAITIATHAPAVTLVHTDAGEDYCYFDDNDGGNLTLVQTVPPVTLVHTDAGEDYLLLNDNDAAALILTQAHNLDVQEAYSVLDDNDGAAINIIAPGIGYNLVVASAVNGHYSENVNLAYNYTTTVGANPGASAPSLYTSSAQAEASYVDLSGFSGTLTATKLHYYMKFRHSEQGRLALYEGGDHDGTRPIPDGATLVLDVGLTTGTAYDQWIEIDITDTALDPSQYLFFCFKSDQSGGDFWIGQINFDDTTRLGELGGWKQDSSIISNDQTVAWPGAYPDPNTGYGSSGSAVAMYLDVTAEAGGNNLRIHEAEHAVVSDDFALILNPVLNVDEAYSLLVDDGCDLESLGSIVIMELGPGPYQASGRTVQSNRMPFDVSAAFPSHNWIRFKVAADTIHTLNLTRMSYGYRSSGDTTTDTPTLVTFGGSNSVSMEGGETEWSDWMPFDVSSGSEILVTIYNDASWNPPEWADGNTRYWKSTDDQTLVVNFNTFLTGSNTWVVQGIEVDPSGSLAVHHASHTHAADEPVLSVTAWTNTDTFYYDAEVAAKNYRMVLPNTLVSQDGDYVRVKIVSHNTDSVTIGGMAIGQQDGVSPEDYADFPTRITFDGGVHTVTVPAGQTKWSDWVPFSFDATADHLVHTHLDGPHKFSYVTTMDTYSRNSAGDDTMTVDVSGYSLENQFYYLVALEVRSRVALTFADADHLHDADNLTLTQTHNLDVAEAYHDLVLDNIDLNMAVNLDVAEADHLHDADPADPLGFTYNLTVAEADHLHDADPAEPLGIGYNLDAAEAHHLSESDNISLSGSITLTVQEAAHDVTEDAIDLTQEHNLSLDEAAHLTESDSAALTQGHNLSLDETAHLLVSPNLTISHILPGQHYLVMGEDTHLSESDNLDLTQAHNLTVADVVETIGSDTINLSGTTTLTVAEAASASYSDDLTITWTVALTVAEAAHVVSDDAPLTLSVIPRLEVADVVETIGSDTPVLTQEHHLEITDNYLISTSDRTAINVYGESRFPTTIISTEFRSFGTRRTITSL